MSFVKFLLAIAVIYLVVQSFSLVTGKSVGDYVFERFPGLEIFYSVLKEYTVTASPLAVFIYTFLAATPILPIPAEGYWIYALTQGLSPYWLVVIVSIAATLGGLVGYGIGYLVPIERIYRFFGKTYTGRWERLPEWVLPFTVFVTSALPFPDLVSFVYGSFRIPVKAYIIFHLLGSAFRAIVLVMLFNHPEIIVDTIKSAWTF